ncbi:TetR/AcrR family transcriptional regulator [Kibdelosporangium phytohabitans]|uniref:TetR family transcriptional regulator n=1 Tax=Kibdelosporangium phytohabitans TaxID=860235 RepID=A0A0N9HZQ5_9PSEU|nr:TetR/AcrR family transcriptional regulator [Kibdelosporangium phytohabitans]ALG12817.1 TetR family transcriptional regulator [Kibdelosporangium phytohabitans]MBE1464507.1 AcrR family transcriptional regulator [Kibdelosporangium phytohabitans]
MNSDIPSVWARPKKNRDQPALSQHQIVSEAIALLDTEGLDALSMRNLGKRLNAGATSLYRHVANKDELIELAIDEVHGEIEVPPADGTDWRAGVTGCAHSSLAMINNHPWVASVLGQIGLSYLGPNVMRMSDGMLALFEKGGFSLAESDLALRAVQAYVIGSGVGVAAWQTSLARSGLSNEQWAERIQPIVLAAAAPYPRLTASIEAAAANTVEVMFTHGLDAVLDGLVAKRSRG